MAEYIEREALRDDIRESYLKLQEIYETLRYERERDICNGELGTFCEVLIRIKDFPAADVAPVVHGRWVQSGQCNHKPYRIRNTDKWTTYKCSVCGYSNGRRFSSNYCPNCGAHMKDGE